MSNNNDLPSERQNVNLGKSCRTGLETTKKKIRKSLKENGLSKVSTNRFPRVPNISPKDFNTEDSNT